MDLNYLLEYVNVITLGICLCLGYVIKTSVPKVNNQYIPSIMLIVGTVANVIVNFPSFNATIVLGGMISGLASTGLYEAMRNLINKDGKKDGEQ